MAKRVRRGVGFATGADLGVNVRNVMLDGPNADDEDIAISRLLRPLAISASTSTSRGVSPSG